MTCIYEPIKEIEPIIEPLIIQPIRPCKYTAGILMTDAQATENEIKNKFIDLIKKDELINELLVNLSRNISSRKNYTERENKQFIKYSKFSKNNYTLNFIICSYDCSILSSIINRLIRDIETNNDYKFILDYLNNNCHYGGSVSGMGLYCHTFTQHLINKAPCRFVFYSTYSNYSIYDETKLKFIYDALESYNIKIMYESGMSD